MIQANTHRGQTAEQQTHLGNTKMPGCPFSSCPVGCLGGFSTVQTPPSSQGLKRRPNDPTPSPMTGHCSSWPLPCLPWVGRARAGGARLQGGVHSLRCSANTGSRKLIRILSMSRFLSTPMLMTQLCSCKGWVGGKLCPFQLEDTRGPSPSSSSPRSRGPACVWLQAKPMSL